MGGERHALLIGNSQYENSEFRKLVSPAYDVSGLRAVLSDAQIGAFDSVQVLENEVESRLRRSITKFFSQRSVDDLLVFYFSGHGIKDAAGHFFLTAVDTDPDDLLGSGVSAELIQTAVQRCRSRKKILFIDACFGGAFLPGMTRRSGEKVTAEQIVGDATGVVIVTATDSLTYAFENEQITGQAEPSVFTKYLIEGMRTGEADLGRDGEVTVDELYRYVRTSVIHEIPNQRPKKWQLEDAGDLVIAQNPNPLLVALPKEIQEKLDDWFPPTKVGAVQLLLGLAQKPNMKKPVEAALEKLLLDDSDSVKVAARNALSQLGTSTIVTSGDKASLPDCELSTAARSGDSHSILEPVPDQSQSASGPTVGKPEETPPSFMPLGSTTVKDHLSSSERKTSQATPTGEKVNSFSDEEDLGKLRFLLLIPFILVAIALAALLISNAQQ